MEYRKLDNLGISSSLLGFGCMRFPLNEDGTINEPESEKMLDLAIAKGVTYLDTAYPYHGGASEPFVGKVLKKYNRSDLFLATKLPIWEIKTKEDIDRLFNEQLKRLDVDYIDFYLLHALDKKKWETVLKLDIIEYCEEMKRQGKIKYLGFSFHDDYNTFEEIATYKKWDFCQIQYNYVDTDEQAGDKGYELTKKLGIPVIIMEPIKGGSLATLPKDIAGIFKEADEKASLAKWAMRWVGSKSNVKVILSGMSNLEQVKDNLETFEDFKVLTKEELKLVDQVAEVIKSKTKNGCTGCAYCIPCPFGVNIPRNFQIWNEYSIYEDENKAKTRYAGLNEGTADHCKACGLCEKMCPQQIKIIEDLKRVVKDMPQ